MFVLTLSQIYEVQDGRGVCAFVVVGYLFEGRGVLLFTLASFWIRHFVLEWGGLGCFLSRNYSLSPKLFTDYFDLKVFKILDKIIELKNQEDGSCVT